MVGEGYGRMGQGGLDGAADQDPAVGERDVAEQDLSRDAARSGVTVVAGLAAEKERREEKDQDCKKGRGIAILMIILKLQNYQWVSDYPLAVLPPEVAGQSPVLGHGADSPHRTAALARCPTWEEC